MSEIYTKSGQTGFEIAVIGMAGRFPGAKNIDEFWENLIIGVESMSFFSDNELEQSGISSELFRKSNYVRARGILESAEYFDSAFFNYSPKESEMLDPQIRVCLECTWQALEDAGYNPETYDGSIGFYAGASDNLYLQVLPALSARSNLAGQFNIEILNNKDYLGLRVSYDLNLRGPAITLYTTCSTSLVAIDMACKSLLIGQCDIALAGGVRINVPNKVGYAYQEGMVNSPDGHTRAFDASANGTNGGEGIGIVVLKPLGEAIADGDYIHAVIKGSAINNDGKRKVGFTAPSVEGQEDVIRAALHMAEVEPESIGYIETHGTGTSLGDPIEIQALVRAFDTDKKQFCKIGSVKPNIGHLDSAAGIAGFIKAVLTLKYKQIPPCINFNTPNPKIDFENTPFCVNTRLSGWKNNGYPLRAGVSSFGIGGTNAHVILEEAPILAGGEPASRPFQLLLLSAKTPSALEKISENLVDYFKKNHPDHGNHENHLNPGFNFADAAYTLQIGRKALKHRKVLVSPGINGAVDALTSRDSGKVHSFVVEKNKMPVIFLFSGQGSQYENMGLDIYREEQVFQQEMNHCFDILRSTTGYNLKDIIYPKEKAPTGPPRKISSKTILQQDIIQPLMFIFEYSLARLFMKWGIKPYAMIGYSIGEYVAACLSGVFTLEDALTLVALRGRLMHEIPGGAMLSVPLTENDLKPLLRLHPGISIAVVNGPSCIVSGPEEAISSFEQRMKEKKYICIRLKISHAGHSKMMDPMLGKFEEKVRQVKLNKPALPYISNVTGTWITVEQAVDPCYWVKQVRETVRFADGLEELLKEKSAIFVEIGPGGDLSSTLMQHHAKTPNHRVINTTRYPRQKVSDVYYLLEKIGRLWLYGQEINWPEFHNGEKTRRISLPTYPFERQRYNFRIPKLDDILKGNLKELSQVPGDKKADIADWFYIPSWKSSYLPLYIPGNASRQSSCLVFMDRCGVGSLLSKYLKQEEVNVITVEKGLEFARKSDYEYTINISTNEDYVALLEEIQRTGRMPDKIVHMFAITGNNSNEAVWEWPEESQDIGFYSLIFLARAIEKLNPDEKTQVFVFTDNMQAVSGEKLLCPEKSTILGPVRVIPQEYSKIRCRSIDIVLPKQGSWQENQLIEQMMVELNTESLEPEIALRGNQRLIQHFEPVRLEKSRETKPRLRQDGIYLITGGLGYVGLILGEYLVKTVNAKLILVGRSAFPPGDEWNQWLSNHELDNIVSCKIRKLQDLKKQGAEIAIFQADVSNHLQMEKVVEEVLERFGRINGVIHCAMHPEGAVIENLTKEVSERVFAPKVNGTIILGRILRDIHLDFFILCSSIHSLLGIEATYCAANIFLNAFAHHMSSVGGVPTLSITWNNWRNFEGGLEFFTQFAGAREIPKSNLRKTIHPLFENYFVLEPDLHIYISNFSVEKDWVLGEHRIAGKAILVGTAFLEMARAAFENCGQYRKNRTVEMKDVYLLTPLEVKEEEEKEIRTILKKYKDGAEFLVISRLDSDENKWQAHARGKIAGVEKDISKRHNIKAIEAECRGRDIHFKEEPHSDDRSIAMFGPRWRSNLKQVKLGAGQALGTLELPEKFESDFDHFKLHPALLDRACAFLLELEKAPSRFYLPFTYKKLIIRESLPEKVVSFIRGSEKNNSKEKFQYFNIIIMDEKGLELMNIQDYTLIEVDETQTTTGSLKVKKDSQPDGLSPLEGSEAFSRALGILSSQVVVSDIDLKDMLSPGYDFRMTHFGGHIEVQPPYQTKKLRPELSNAYISPQNEVEQTLADLWQKFFGFEKIGIHDDFFELGGNSLKALALISFIHRDIGVKLSVSDFFGRPNVKKLAAYIAGQEESAFYSLELAEEKAYYVLSSAQMRLYILNEFDSSSTAYNLPRGMLIEGKIDNRGLEETFMELIKRHESLRTSFQLKEGKPVQIIHKEVDFKIDYLDAARNYSGGYKTEEIAEEFIKPFDLSTAPLIRVKLVKLQENKYLLLIDMHHIIADAVSVGILVHDFIHLYKRDELPAFTIQYRDFSEWSDKLMKIGIIEPQEKYWREKLAGEIPLLNMPMDFERPGRQNFEGNTLTFTIPRETAGKLELLAKEQNVTLNILFLALYTLLLSKYSDQQDIVIGLITAGRKYPGLENIIGLFGNYLPIRNAATPTDTFPEFLNHVKRNFLDAFENQDYPYEKLIDLLDIKIDLARNPLFDTMLIFHNELESKENQDIENLSFIDYELVNRTSKIDFKLDIYLDVDSPGKLNCFLEYNLNLFREETMKKFICHFMKLIDEILRMPGQQLFGIELFTGEEKIKFAEMRKCNVQQIEMPLKAVVCATFTAEPIKNYITWWGKKYDLEIEAEFTPYNQVFQQLLDESGLLSTNREINLLLVRFEDWIRDDNSSDEKKCKKLEKNVEEFIAILRNKEKQAPYFVGLFPVSTHLSLSPAVMKTLEKMNTMLKKALDDIGNVYAVDFTGLCDLYSIDVIFDPLKDKESHLPFSDEFYAAMGTFLARKIYAYKNQRYKVIVLDCDHTIWNGICGEDGPSGIEISPSYRELQEFMVGKYNEGFLLTLCSKNNEADVWEVFEQRPEMPLKKEHFVNWRINWRPKSENLRELAWELNLGIESFIFVDDSPAECLEVETNCSGALVLQLPANIEDIPLFLKHVWAFDRLKVTLEDRKRSHMYIQERKRKQTREQHTNLEDFLESLDLKISLMDVQSDQIPRVSQLTQRVNQFNLSAIRRTEGEIRKLLNDDKMKCIIVDVSDRFGDYGLVGALITKEMGSKLFIDTFVLSCRVLGRRVEDAVLLGLRKYCEKKYLSQLYTCFVPTLKNKPFLEFLERKEWVKVDQNPEGWNYMLSIDKISSSVNYIDCKISI